MKNVNIQTPKATELRCSFLDGTYCEFVDFSQFEVLQNLLNPSSLWHFHCTLILGEKEYNTDKINAERKLDRSDNSPLH